MRRGGPPWFALLGFALGTVGAIVFLVAFVTLRDGGAGGEESAAASETPSPTAEPSPTPEPTPASFPDPESAVEYVVRSRLGQPYLGPCPPVPPTTEAPPPGLCTVSLFRAEPLVTMNVASGLGKEVVGEVVMTRDEAGGWTVTFVKAPPPGAALAVGTVAVVYGAGDCLRFRETASINAPVVTCQSDGARGRVIEGPVSADGHTWWRLEGLGWASGQFLAPYTE
ncbi:MAG TPA: hypothetical protein VIO14_08605 [Dehalococcoidia bacterium]